MRMGTSGSFGGWGERSFIFQEAGGALAILVRELGSNGSYFWGAGEYYQNIMVF